MSLITVSHRVGTKGQEVSWLVADRLNVALFNDRRLTERAAALGLTAEDLDGLDERAPGFWDQAFSRKPERYRDLLERVVYEIASAGQGVIVGHGSQVLLREFSCAFHVRIHADIRSRVRELRQRQGMKKEAAERLIRKMDDRQQGYFRYAYQLDMESADLYDLVINTQKMRPDTAAEVIEQAARSEDVSACSIHALDTMQRFSLQRQVHASLLESAVDVSTLNVEVPATGAVVVSGMTASQEDADRLPDIVRSVTGVSELVCDLSVWTYAL